MTLTYRNGKRKVSSGTKQLTLPECRTCSNYFFTQRCNLEGLIVMHNASLFGFLFLQSLVTRRDMEMEADRILEVTGSLLPYHKELLQSIKSKPCLLNDWLARLVKFLRSPGEGAPEEATVQCTLALLSQWMLQHVCLRVLQVATPVALLELQRQESLGKIRSFYGLQIFFFLIELSCYCAAHKIHHSQL